MMLQPPRKNLFADLLCYVPKSPRSYGYDIIQL